MKIIIFFISCVICFVSNNMVTVIADTLNGQGAVCFSDNSKYVGQFKDGIIQGQGTIDFPDGSKYSGAFLAGEMNGQGTMVFPDGSKYVGQFKEGKIHGQGKITFPDGSIYDGTFKNDKYHGDGVWSSPFGIYYEGQFKNGKFDGQGIYSLPDGSRYVGLFREDHFYGHGAWDKGKKSGSTSSGEPLTLNEVEAGEPVENTNIMNESFSEMDEDSADNSVLHEEAVQQKIDSKQAPDAHIETYSQNDEHMLEGDLQKEEKDLAVTLEARNQESTEISILDIEGHETPNSEPNADPVQMGSVPNSYASSQLGFSVQVGAFVSRNNAERLTSLLVEKGYPASMLPMLDCINKPWYTVRIGSYSSLPEARESAISFTEKEQMMATVRPVDSL